VGSAIAAALGRANHARRPPAASPWAETSC
jgi:hypothetical protein